MKKIKIFILVLALLLCSIPTSFSKGKGGILKKKSPYPDYPWLGYNKEDKHGYPDLRVNLNGGFPFNVYCFNKEVSLPNPYPNRDHVELDNDSWYKKIDGSGQAFLKHATNPIVNVSEEYADKTKKEKAKILNDAILRIIYNGYPNNANGVMDGLNPILAIAATQQAIWYFSDGIKWDAYAGGLKGFYESRHFGRAQLDLMVKAANKLRLLALDEDVENKVPKEYKLNLFISRAPTAYQHLLSAEFVPQKPNPGKIVVTKEWKGIKEDKEKPPVYFQLIKNNVVLDTKKLEGNKVTFQISNKKDIGLYTVKEVDKDGEKWEAEGFMPTKVSGEKGKFIFTNEKKSTTEISFKKVWKPEIPKGKKVVVKLLANGKSASKVITSKEYQENIQDIELTGDELEAWTGEFKGLPLYDSKGKEIQYSIKESKVEGYTTSIEQPKKDPNGNYSEATITNIKEDFSVELLKLDGYDDKPLDKVKFKLYKSDNVTEVIKDKVYESDSKGKINLGDLKDGIYYLEEIEAHEGYERLDSKIKIEVTKEGNVILGGGKKDNKTIYNYKLKLTSIAIKKVDERGKLLRTASFRLTNLDEKSSDKNPTQKDNSSDKDKIIYFSQLKKGNYKLEETSAPDGYNKINVYFTFEVDTKLEDNKVISFIKSISKHEDGKSIDIFESDGSIPNGDEIISVKSGESKTIGLKVVNLKKPDLQIVKVDGKDQELKLADAEFELLMSKVNEDGSLTKKESVSKQITDKDGLVTFKGLDDGLYWIKETQAPKDYIKHSGELGPFLVQNGVIYKTDLTDDGKIMDSSKEKLETIENGLFNYEVKNFKAEFPSTGGIGTGIFTAIGLSIMLTSLTKVSKGKRKDPQ